MNLKNKILLSFVFLFILTGCFTTNSYVDPSFGKASYGDINEVSERYKIEVFTEFQRNGKILEYLPLQTHAERVLRASGVIVPSKSSDYSITLIVNNVGDLGKAMAKGFGSGLTFGLIGTMVSDYYEIKISYTDNKGSTTVRDYKHAMHSTIGNAKGPAGVLPDTADNAFGKIIEETLLNFISDMQKLKKLSFIPFYRDEAS